MKNFRLYSLILAVSALLVLTSCSTSELDDVHGGTDAIEQVAAVPTTPGGDGYHGDVEMSCVCGTYLSDPGPNPIPGWEHLMDRCKFCGKWYFIEMDCEDPEEPVEPEEPWEEEAESETEDEHTAIEPL